MGNETKAHVVFGASSGPPSPAGDSPSYVWPLRSTSILLQPSILSADAASVIGGAKHCQHCKEGDVYDAAGALVNKSKAVRGNYAECL